MSLPIAPLTRSCNVLWSVLAAVALRYQVLRSALSKANLPTWHSELLCELLAIVFLHRVAAVSTKAVLFVECLPAH